MSDWDDDNYDNGRGSYRGAQSGRGQGGDADFGSALKKNVSVDDSGKLEVFGKSFDLGSREAAFFLAPIVNVAITNAGLYGAKYAGKAGTTLGSALQMKHHAPKVGKAFYTTWLYGLPLLDVALGVKKTVQEGVKDMHELQAQARPLLAASDDKHVGIGQALTSNYTVLAHARAKAWAHFRHNLAGTLAGTVRALPAMVMGYNQSRLDEIMHPETYAQLKTRPNMTATEKEEISKGVAELNDKKLPKGEAQRIRTQMRATVKEFEPVPLADELERLKVDRKNFADKFELEIPAPQSVAERDSVLRYRGGYNHRDLDRKDEALVNLSNRIADLEKAQGLEPEYKRLLSKFKIEPEARYQQLRVIDELKEIDSLRSPVPSKTEEEAYKRDRQKLLDKLEDVGAPKEMWKKLGELKQERLKHLSDLKSGTTSSRAHSQENPVIEMFNWIGNDEARQRMFHGKNNHAIDYKKNIQNLQAMPAVASVVGDIVDRKLSSTKLPDTAWDKIVEMQAYLGRHHNPEHAQIAADVQNVFKQHAKDLGLTYHLSGRGFEDTTNAIADAIVDKKLHAQALANILDDRKIVVFGKDDADFGDLRDVRQQLDMLVARYSQVSDKEIYNNAPFTKESLKRLYTDIPQEEKPFFTMLFPPGVLEKAGVPKEEVARNREEGAQNFTEDLADKLRLLIGAGHDEIRKQGVKGRYIDAVESLESGFRRADKDGEASEFVRDNLKDVTKALRNIETSAKKPGEMWKDFVARGQAQPEEQAARSPMDHAMRESGDEMHIGN